MAVFYDPKCGHYDKILPEIKKLAAIYKDNAKIIIGRVDVSFNKHITTSQGVKATPSFFYFSQGESQEYRGPQTATDLSRWIDKKLNQKLRIIRSYPELQSWLNDNPIAFVLFTDENSPKIQELAKAIKFEVKASVGVSIHPGALAQYKVSSPSFVVFKHKDDKKKVYEGPITAEKLKEFIAAEKYNWVLPLGDEIYEDFLDKNKPGLFLFRNSTSGSELDKMIDEISVENHQKFVISVGDLYEHIGFAEMLGVSPEKQPFSLIIKPNNGILQKFPLEEVSKDGLVALIKSWEDGTAKRLYKSQYIPADDTRLNLKSFKKLIPNADKDILIHFYAPWCGICRYLDVQLNEVAESLGNLTLSIYKIDAMANDIPGHDIFGFPTLKLFKSGESLGIEYTNESRKAEEIIKFIQKNTKETGKYASPKAKTKQDLDKSKETKQEEQEEYVKEVKLDL